jgi:hypothetical protein
MNKGPDSFRAFFFKSLVLVNLANDTNPGLGLAKPSGHDQVVQAFQEWSFLVLH